MSFEQLGLVAAREGLNLVNVAFEVGREIWHQMDASTEKPKPTEYLSTKAIRAVQGISAKRVNEEGQ